MTEVFPRVDDETLRDLGERLRRYRRVPVPSGDGWSRGVAPDFLDGLIGYWRDHFDYRAQERRIAALPWTVHDDATVPMRLLHHVVDDSRPTVLLLHGWPDSILRFERLLPLLADVNLVVPCLPGFPFSLPVPQGGMSAVEMAGAVGELMDELGHDRYVVSAGDIGSAVAEALAAARPHRVAALHLTDVSQRHFMDELPADLTPQEREYVDRGETWQADEGAYSHEQSTKPHTLAAALGDSPAGLASWIVEKLRTWTDCGGDVESVFTKDELLTWVMAYWVTGTVGTSFSPYVSDDGRPWDKVLTPTVFMIFPHDLVNAPRHFAERLFDVRVWKELDRGGHFAAWERPDDYAWGVRQAIELAAVEEKSV